LHTTISKGSLKKLKSTIPGIIDGLSECMSSYRDEEMELKRRYVCNIPYFSDIWDEQLIDKLLFSFKFKIFNKGQLVLQKG
jgi:hypothetical protein